MKKPMQFGGFRLVFVLLMLLLAISAGGFWVWRDFERFSNAPLLPAKSSAVIDFPPGAGLDALLQTLSRQAANTGKHWQWQMLIKQLGLGQKLKAGEFEITDHDTPRTLLFAIAEGKVVQHKLTIIEGTRFSDVRRLLAGQSALQASIGGLSDAEVMAKIGAPESNPEGMFLPETYSFPKGFSDIELLKKAYWDLQRELKTAWAKKAPDVPLASPYEALILASIVEKETGKASERPVIAGVFTRRLKLNMRLQTDPTVIYGIGEKYDGNIRKSDLTTDTPYNTYTRAGLPPTPIAMPGKAAINAAIQPAPGDALYFVAKGDGSHQFSASYAEHDKAVSQYQRR
jgi:UPF0755 protein